MDKTDAESKLEPLPDTFWKVITDSWGQITGRKSWLKDWGTRDNRI